MVPRALKFIALSLIFACQSQGVSYAKDLTGNVEKKVKTGNSKVIQGGIKDDASLRPSVKVVPRDSAKFDRFNNYKGKVEQFKGGRMYSSGRPVNRKRPMLPTRSYQRHSHIITPISSYHLTPRNGVMTFGGHGVIRAPSHRSVTTFGTRHSVLSPRSVKGVTTFVPGYQTTIQNSYKPRRHRSVRVMHGGGYGTGNGVTSWSPAHITNLKPYRVHVSTPHSRNGITAYAPGYSTSQAIIHHGSSVHTPGSSVTRVAYNKGVSSWVPGYQVTVQTNGGYKTSLGGKWFDSKPQPRGLSAGSAARMNPGIFVQPVLPSPLLAKANLLPQLQKGEASRSISWDDWYRNFASSIYTRWQTMVVGPGTAKVRVTVTRKRELECRIVDFIPAFDVQRDINEETDFRVSALRAVRSVKRSEIPAFPPLADEDRVTFDVVLKRKVDGPIGIDVSKLK